MTQFLYQYLSNCEKPEKWLFFLHGYNNTQDEMSHIYNGLLHKTKKLAIIAPIGQQVSSTDSNRHSWWKVSNFDANGKRIKPETSIEEIVDIYNQIGSVLELTANQINTFIDNSQQKYGFTDKQTYIAGFSQGAMLGIWTSLIRDKQIAGCFSCSGLVASVLSLKDKIKSKPDIYLLHGNKDKQVLYKCHDYNKYILKSLGLKTTAVTYDGLNHQEKSVYR